MGLRGMSPTTPISAAITLAGWISKEGRPPTFRECSAGNGLNHPDFYYRKFQASTFCSAISMAIDMASMALLSTAIVSHIPDTTSKKYKMCLGECGSKILDEGAHIRFCVQCRKSNKRRESYDQDMSEYGYGLSRKTLKRVSIDFGGIEEMIQW